jgi:hypothetical protein
LGRFHRGAYIADGGYEHRVTARCLEEDLGAPEEGELESLSGHEIIRALRHKHERDPTPTDTVGPAAGAMTLGVLRYGNDHRGATWFDSRAGVLWLCAYRVHRSGMPDDAFPYFDGLRRARRIFPTDADRERALRDQAIRLVESIPEEAQRLVGEAATRQGEECAGMLGPVPVCLVVIEIEGIRELHIAVDIRRADPNMLAAVLVGLCPNPDEFGAWRPTTALPTRPLDRTCEIGYSCLLQG